MKRGISRLWEGVWTFIASQPGPDPTVPMPTEPWNPPRRADLISISWNSPAHRVVPDLAPPEDPKVFADAVCFVIGVEGYQIGTLCQSELWTLGYLKNQCRAGRFVWPRGLALIDEFRPHRTLPDLEREIRRLCHRECADTYEALLNSFEKYGWHFYEVQPASVDKDGLAPLQGKLLGITYEALAETEPENPSHFGDTVRIRVGMTPSAARHQDDEYPGQQRRLTARHHELEFEFLLCTPSWFEARHNLSNPFVCQHVAFVDRFERTTIEAAVAQRCRERDGFDESEVAESMGHLAKRIGSRMERR